MYNVHHCLKKLLLFFVSIDMLVINTLINLKNYVTNNNNNNSNNNNNNKINFVISMWVYVDMVTQDIVTTFQ